jgi:hypothetical protein
MAMRCPIASTACLPLVLLAIAACGEDSTLPQAPGEPAAAAPAFATAASNTWRYRAPRPMGISKGSLSSVTNASGQSIVYAIGGRIEGTAGWPIHVYTPSTDTWTTRQTRVPTAFLNGVGKIGNRLYFSGGWYSDPSERASNQLYAYDYTNDRLIRKADMPYPTAEGVTGVIKDKLYVLPGACSGEGPGFCESEPFRRLYRYDPITNTWLARPGAPHYHASGGGGVLNGKFYVVGGYIAGGGRVADLDVYDPVTNKWSTLGPSPVSGEVTATTLNGKLFVVQGGGGAFSYDPATNTWKQLATPLPTNINDIVHPAYPDAITRVTIGTSGFVFGMQGTGEFEGTTAPSQLYTP